MPLGLVSSETIDDYWSQNTRRRIFYSYPNGTAPLTGLLSMTESEDTPQPQFGWEEKRWASIKTQTAAGPGATGNKTGPFATVSTTTASGDSDGIFSLAAFGAIRIYVDDASMFQVDDTIRLFNVGTAASGTTATGTLDLSGRVTAANTTGADYIEVVSTAVATNISNVSANSVDRYVLLTGSAYAEGARSRTGRTRFPYELTNNTQIFKTPFELTRTALKEPLKYDKTGAYKDIAKDNGIDHLSQIEWTLFFGVKGKTTAIDDDTGSTVSRRLTGGLRYFLDRWEEGSDYGQEDVSAQTDYITYTNKRVIKLGGATISKANFNALMSRLFERTNASSWDKLCLCGPDYLAKVSDAFERQVQFTSLRESTHKGFDFELVKHSSNAGSVYYKMHPLFNDPMMRNSAFYVDLGYIGYRPLSDSDTDIQPMIQLPDADKRKDQWLTECGFEFRFPEANMYVENLGGITL